MGRGRTKHLYSQAPDPLAGYEFCVAEGSTYQWRGCSWFSVASATDFNGIPMVQSFDQLDPFRVSEVQRACNAAFGFIGSEANVNGPQKNRFCFRGLKHWCVMSRRAPSCAMTSLLPRSLVVGDPSRWISFPPQNRPPLEVSASRKTTHGG